MSATSRQRLEAHERCDDVCVRFARIIDATPGGRNMRARLGSSVMESSGLLRRYHRKLDDEHSWSQKRQQLRRQLRAALLAFIRIGRVVRGEGQVLLACNRLARMGDTRLGAEARAMFDIVMNDADVFIANGLPRRLLESVPGLADALKHAVTQQSLSRIEHHVLREVVRKSLAAGDRTLLALDVTLADLADDH